MVEEEEEEEEGGGERLRTWRETIYPSSGARSPVRTRTLLQLGEAGFESGKALLSTK